MNLKTKLIICLLCCMPLKVYSAEPGFSAVKHRNYVVCGIDADYNYLAYKKDGIWSGFDADMCRAVAQALLQDAESFRLKPVKSDQIGKMLNSGAVDIMLGHNQLSPKTAIKQNIASTDIIYYDKIVLAARNKKVNASSLKDYAGSKVCVQDNSMSLNTIIEYNSKYNLNFSFLKFPQLSLVKNAFYLKRCELVVGDEIYISGIIKDLRNSDSQILPEELSIMPVIYYTSGNNNYFNIALRSIFGALQIAAHEEISATNTETFKADKSPSVQNILDFNSKFWSQFNLDSSWLIEYIKRYGNYNDVMERNIGYGSPLNLNTSYNTPFKQGGFLIYTPFL